MLFKAPAFHLLKTKIKQFQNFALKNDQHIKVEPNN